MNGTLRPRGAVPGLFCLALIALACHDATPPLAPRVATGNAIAFGLWTPGANDTCTPAIHDAYRTVGPDNKRYPTWHPPVDPVTGCRFGHEHGRDPRGSALYGEVGAIPFGFANEQLEAFDPLNPRREDHVGHKVEWENNVPMHFGSDAASSLFDVRCDVLVKLHQGTHSKDAFTNNVHELVYHVRCTDGLALHVTMLAAIGRPGEFVRSCDRTITVQAGVAVPANSPVNDGQRVIPDRACVDQEILVAAGQHSDFGALHESWETHNSIRTPNGHQLAFFNPYFQVGLPSRFYDASAPNVTGRPVAVCAEVDSASGRRARGDLCDAVQVAAATGLSFDDPRSPFNGSDRFVDINYNEVRNAGGPTAWFTDPYGRVAQRDSFPGSIRQFISSYDNTRGGIGNGGPSIGRDRSVSATMVHAPN